VLYRISSGAALGHMTAHQVEFAYFRLTSVLQIRGLVIQSPERPSTIVSLRSPKREMWMERPRLTVEATFHQSPLDVLLETPKSGTWFDSDPDFLRAADGWKRAKTLYRNVQAGRGRGRVTESLLHTLEPVLSDLAKKFQRYVILLRLHPTHGNPTFPQNLGGTVDSVALLFRQVQRYEKTHGRETVSEEGVELDADDFSAVLLESGEYMPRSYRDAAAGTTGHQRIAGSVLEAC